jgi:hypothetical protein
VTGTVNRKDGSYSYAYNMITHGVLAPLDELTIRLTGLPSVFKPHILINGTYLSLPTTTSILKGAKGDLGKNWWFASTYLLGPNDLYFKSISGYIENSDEIKPSTKSLTL